MKFTINRIDLKNVKVTAIQNIIDGELIGAWVMDKPTTKKSRYLFQEHMSQIWWETDDLGRYCNHSLTPNTIVILNDDKLELRARKQIELGEEIVVDYREITSYTGYTPKINF